MKKVKTPVTYYVFWFFIVLISMSLMGGYAQIPLRNFLNSHLFRQRLHLI